MFMHHGFYGHHGFFGFHAFWFIATIVAIIPFWRICLRAGLSPWLSLLLFIPLVNIIFVYYVAFAEWPSQRGNTGGTPPGYGSGTGAGTAPPT